MIPAEMVTFMERRRLVAEVRVETAIQALSLIDALAAGGVSTIEVSLTIPGAHEILGHVATRQDVTVGAGAVLDAGQASAAISAGARFVASPICAPELAAPCREAKVACILGALTPTEIILAQRAGAEMVKLFPAEALGGPMYVRALMRQLTHVSLQIAGGFTVEHMIEYLSLPIRTLALGTLLTPRVLVERGNWLAITNRARAFVECVANPHANQARFLAQMGVAPQPHPGQRPAQPAPPQQLDQRDIVAAVPTINIPPSAVAAVNAAVERREAEAEEYAGSGYGSGSHSGSRSGGAASAFLNRGGSDAIFGGSNSGSNSGSNGGALSDASKSFRPWDSRPIELGDDEDWLR